MNSDAETFQVVYTCNGNCVERIYTEANARRMYAIATNGPHYEAVSLERWDGVSFVSVEDWRRND